MAEANYSGQIGSYTSGCGPGKTAGDFSKKKFQKTVKSFGGLKMIITFAAAFEKKQRSKDG